MNHKGRTIIFGVLQLLLPIYQRVCDGGLPTERTNMQRHGMEVGNPPTTSI